MIEVPDNTDVREVLAIEVRAKIEEAYGVPGGVDLIHLRYAINEVEDIACQLGVDFAEWLDQRADISADATAPRTPNPLTEVDLDAAAASALAALDAVIASAQDVPDGVLPVIRAAVAQVICTFAASLGAAAK